MMLHDCVDVHFKKASALFGKKNVTKLSFDNDTS